MLDDKLGSGWTKKQVKEFERNSSYDNSFRMYGRIRKWEDAYILLESGFEQEALALIST